MSECGPLLDGPGGLAAVLLPGAHLLLTRGLWIAGLAASCRSDRLFTLPILGRQILDRSTPPILGYQTFPAFLSRQARIALVEVFV